MAAPDPVRPATDEARALARRLLAEARHAALGTLDPATGGPVVTRAACLWRDGRLLVLASTLALHARALAADPRASALLGEPGPKGDPLTHPRLTLQAAAAPADKAAHRAAWLAAHPRAGLYFDFADMALWALEPLAAHLNGGFGRAFRLTPRDLGEPGPPA